MKILLKNATIIDPKGAFHFQQVDIYICNGIIGEIGEDLSVEADKVIKINPNLRPGDNDDDMM